MTGSEVLGKEEAFIAAEEKVTPPDGAAALPRDDGLVRLDLALARDTSRGAAAYRLHFTLRPSAARRAHWDDGAGPLQVWLEDLPARGVVDRRLLTAAPFSAPDAPRELDLELRVPGSGGSRAIRGYAAYGVCEDVGGVCTYLRQDFELELPD